VEGLDLDERDSRVLTGMVAVRLARAMDRSQPFESWAKAVERRTEDLFMPVLGLARVLHRMAPHPDTPNLILRLKRQRSQPWIALAGALEEVRRVEGT